MVCSDDGCVAKLVDMVCSDDGRVALIGVCSKPEQHQHSLHQGEE